jgi:hypothetical protein
MPLQVAINHLGDPIFRTAIKKYINFSKADFGESTGDFSLKSVDLCKIFRIMKMCARVTTRGEKWALWRIFN